MRLLPGRLELYVLTRTLTAVAGALAVIAAVILLIDFVDVSRTVGGRADAGFVTLLGLTLLKAPATILALLPFAFLFGTLAAFVGLNRRSELIAMRASGVSAWRFVLPSAGLAFVIGILTVTALGPIAASADGLWQRERARLSGSTPGERQEAVWLREGDDGRQVIIRAAGQDRAAGRLLDVAFFIYTVGPDGTRAFSERIDAASATLSAGRWRLVDAVGAQVGQRAVTYQTLDLPSSLADEEAFERFARPQSTPFWSLWRQIQRIEQAGFSSTAYRLRLHQQLSLPLTFAAMAVLAAAFSLRLMRLGDLARMSAAAVVLGFGFFFLNQFSQALGAAEVVPPFVAAWLPPVLAALAASTLLIYTEDG